MMQRKTPVPEYKACDFIKKETVEQMFSCEFCKLSKGRYTSVQFGLQFEL